MKPLPRSARRIAVLGAACFIVAGLVPPARASGPPLPIYTGSSTAQGAVASFALRPSIFDPLATPGIAFATSTLSSQAGGAAHSLAGQIYGGEFATGALGCAGLKGWVQATYPASGGCGADGKDTLYRTQPSSFGKSQHVPQLDDVLNTVLERSSLTLADMHAHALLGDTWANVRSTDYTLRTAPTEPPSVAIGDLTANTKATSGDVLAHEATVTAKDVSLMNGIVKIGSLVSRAHATSDGTTGVAEASIKFSDVEVLINGSYHRATIDNKGIRVTGDDPTFSRDQSTSLQESLDEAFAKAGVKIFVSSPTKVVDGPSADASISGLTFAIQGEIPNVPIPSQLGPVVALLIDNFPTKCGNDPPVPSNAPQVPVCFGPGVLPGPGSSVAVSFTIGSVDASSVGNLGYVFGGGGGCLTCGFGGGGSVPVPGTFMPGTTPPPTQQTGNTAQPSFVTSGPRLGIFARLPSAVLMWTGMLLLVLAVGAALGPSLRHDAD